MTWIAEKHEQTIARLQQIRSGPPPAPELGHGLFYPGGLHTVSGEPGVGKSLLLAAIVADQLSVPWERDADPFALWLEFEQGPARTLRRLIEFGATDEALCHGLEHLHYPSGFPQALELDALGPHKIVVVDALTGLLSACGLSSSSDTDIELAYSKILRPFADMGAAVVVIDHVTKNRDTRGKWATGSRRKVGAVDVALALDSAIPLPAREPRRRRPNSERWRAASA